MTHIRHKYLALENHNYSNLIVLKHILVGFQNSNLKLQTSSFSLMTRFFTPVSFSVSVPRGGATNDELFVRYCGGEGGLCSSQVTGLRAPTSRVAKHVSPGFASPIRTNKIYTLPGFHEPSCLQNNLTNVK